MVLQSERIFQTEFGKNGNHVLTLNSEFIPLVLAEDIKQELVSLNNAPSFVSLGG